MRFAGTFRFSREILKYLTYEKKFLDFLIEKGITSYGKLLFNLTSLVLSIACCTFVETWTYFHGLS